jgi:cation:H+ antiporter
LYVVLASTEHDAAQGFTNLMLWLVFPLVLATIVAVTAYELGLRKGRLVISTK